MNTTTKNEWAIVSAITQNGYDDISYALTFNGELAADLQVAYNFDPITGSPTNVTTCITFTDAHEGNDGAYITYLALKALYDNQTAMRERTGASGDFEFVIDAFEFAGSLLKFTY